MQLDGRTALITGAGRGIGRAIALGFAREGADVGLLARTESQLREVAQEIEQIGRRAVVQPCDVTDPEAVARSVDAVAEDLGRLDVLVNNAGGGFERKRIGEDNPRNWAGVIELNLTGAYYCARSVLPHMRRTGGGSIINVGSGMGHEARAGNSSYNAAKAGLWMLTRCLALEVWQDNILLNELIPGPVYTELTSGLFQPDSPHPVVESEWVKRPDELVPLALYLATQTGHGPTGQSFSLARRPL